MKLPFLFLLLLLSLALPAQSWDYVDFTPGDKSITNACIDDSDNVYTTGNSINLMLRKFDPLGSLTWEKDISGLLLSGATGFGGIEYVDSKVYTVGKHPSSYNGVIIESGVALGDTPFVWDEITRAPSTSHCMVHDLKVVGNDIYVVGSFGITGVATTISFFDGTTLSANRPSTFIAKYSTLAGKTLVWAKKIMATGGGYPKTTGESIDLDDLGNIFISGQFKGSTIFYNGVTPYVFTSTSIDFSDSFLAKFDNNGNFNSTFNLKTRDGSGSSRFSYDVEVSNENEAVYWSERDNVITHKKDGSGEFLWQKNITSSTTFSIEANHCGEVYVTGRVSETLRAPCGSDYFALSLDHTDGSTIWSSTATSCNSYGAEVLIDSSNKEVIVGTFYGSGGDAMEIDTDYTSTSSKGYFIGRYDDYPVNSCCKNIPNFDLPNIISMCDTDFETLCGPLSTFPSPIYTYEWWGPGDELLSTSRCFTPDGAGSYTLVITDQDGCVFTHTVTILFAVPLVPSIADVYWCTALPARVGWLSDPFPHSPCEINYEWTYNGSIIVGADSYNVPFSGDGTYCVTVSTDLFSVTRCFEVERCCSPETEFSVNWVNNGDGSYSLKLTNVSSEFYVSDSYYLEKDCNNDGMPGPWEYVGESTRTTDFELSVDFSPLDPNCLYRITHRVPSPCMMMVYVHTEYVGGSPGIINGDEQEGNGVESNVQKSLTISPNPTTNVANLYIDNIEGTYEINVYNLQGQLINSLETSERRTAIDLSDLEAGIYLIKASNGIDSFTRRVVKM